MERKATDFRWTFEGLESKTTAELQEIKLEMRKAFADRIREKNDLAGAILFYQSKCDEYDAQS